MHNRHKNRFLWLYLSISFPNFYWISNFSVDNFQMFAAVYAYMQNFRKYMEDSEDDFMKIAISLGKKLVFQIVKTI